MQTVLYGYCKIVYILVEESRNPFIILDVSLLDGI